MSCILISFEKMSISTLSGDPHQLVSFITNKTNILYSLVFIHAHCNRSVVNHFSLVAHVHLIILNPEIQPFEHLTWPNVSVNFNITMLHFVLYHNVTSYISSLLSCIYVNTTKLCNIMCTLVATSVILRRLECTYRLRTKAYSMQPLGSLRKTFPKPN